MKVYHKMIISCSLKDIHKHVAFNQIFRIPIIHVLYIWQQRNYYIVKIFLVNQESLGQHWSHSSNKQPLKVIILVFTNIFVYKIS